MLELKKNLPGTLVHGIRSGLKNIQFRQASDGSSTHSLYRGMGTVVQKLQESNVCSAGEEMSHLGRSLDYNVYNGAIIECETVDRSKFRC